VYFMAIRHIEASLSGPENELLKYLSGEQN
jgi:hypothetical protein